MFELFIKFLPMIISAFGDKGGGADGSGGGGGDGLDGLASLASALGSAGGGGQAGQPPPNIAPPRGTGGILPTGLPNQPQQQIPPQLQAMIAALSQQRGG